MGKGLRVHSGIYAVIEKQSWYLLMLTCNFFSFLSTVFCIFDRYTWKMPLLLHTAVWKGRASKQLFKKVLTSGKYNLDTQLLTASVETQPCCFSWLSGLSNLHLSLRLSQTPPVYSHIDSTIQINCSQLRNYFTPSWRNSISRKGEDGQNLPVSNTLSVQRQWKPGWGISRPGFPKITAL